MRVMFCMQELRDLILALLLDAPSIPKQFVVRMEIISCLNRVSTFAFIRQRLLL